MKYIILILLICSCTIHKKYIAINRYFIVQSIEDKYINVYSPSTKETIYYLQLTIYYPKNKDINIGDTLILVQKNKTHNFIKK
jgi:hypothetical protein